MVCNMKKVGDIADSETRAQFFHRAFVKVFHLKNKVEAEVVGIVRTGPSTRSSASPCGQHHYFQQTRGGWCYDYEELRSPLSPLPLCCTRDPCLLFVRFS